MNNTNFKQPPLACKDFGFISHNLNLNKIKNAVILNQNDCLNGTIRIKKPGHYILAEDLMFHFNESNNFKPTDKQTQGTNAQYPLAPHGAYNLGFFAGITIEADNVILDLNGCKITQSDEFSLNQRFFALIELASSPFIPKQGPSNFGNKIT